MFESAARVLSHFQTSAISAILNSYLDFLLAELSGLLIFKYTHYTTYSKHHHHYHHHASPGAFLSIVARLDEEAIWFRRWLHNATLREAILKKLTDFIVELIEPVVDYFREKNVQGIGPLARSQPQSSNQINEMEIFQKELPFKSSIILASSCYPEIVRYASGQYVQEPDDLLFPGLWRRKDFWSFSICCHRSSPISQAHRRRNC